MLAHLLAGRRAAAVLAATSTGTAASVERSRAGDGDAWLAAGDDWQRVRDPLLDALFTPVPAGRGRPSGCCAGSGTAGALDLARLGVLPVRRLGQETVRRRRRRLLLTGNAMHSDVPPEGAGSGVFGWLLAMLGQDVGFPVPAAARSGSPTRWSAACSAGAASC